MFNTYIYHLLPPTCFGVRYTIFRETTALFDQELYGFLQCCYTVCATEYIVYPVVFKLQCLLRFLKQSVVRSSVPVECQILVKMHIATH
jgi:hypothetical protein